MNLMRRTELYVDVWDWDGGVRRWGALVLKYLDREDFFFHEDYILQRS